MFDEAEYHGPAALPGEPTDAPPGSERKIQIMTERAARHEQLFHPQDGQRKLGRNGRRPVAVLPPWAPETPAAPRRLPETAGVGATS